MREIIFRGKREDNGEWVYGSLHIQYGEMSNGTRLIEYRILGMNGQVDYVIPETVGQYTGLTDKNGKKIFEGDITQYDKDGALYEIIFVKEGGKTQFCSKFIPDGSVGYVNEDRDKVIGNIHDNPELLEVIR